MNEYKVARFLGWFSIGLGVTELVAPRMITRLLGTSENDTLVRAYGVREIASGIGILAQSRQPSPWVWSRVGGDALDLATLGTSLVKDNPNRRNVGIAMAMVAGVTALDLFAGLKLRSSEKGHEEDDFSNVRWEARNATRPFMEGIALADGAVDGNGNGNGSGSGS
jgi:hypothetical protein